MTTNGKQDVLFTHPTDPEVYPITVEFEEDASKLYHDENLGNPALDRLPFSTIIQSMRDYIGGYEHGEASSQDLFPADDLDTDRALKNVLLDFLMFLVAESL